MTAGVLEEKTEGSTASPELGLLRDSYESGRTRPLAFRHKQLGGLARFLSDCEEQISSRRFTGTWGGRHSRFIRRRSR